MTPEHLARTIEDFLADAPQAVVIEQGQVIFDLAAARYAISTQQSRCLLHLWSEERNTVRRVLDSERQNGTLRLTVQKFGQPRATHIEFCRDSDQRTPSTRRAHREAYARMLAWLLQREFPGFHTETITAAMDLERSFGPIYTRALLRKGMSAFAVIGVNAQETQASIDAALTFGLLWLDVCRERLAGKALVEGLKIFVPAQKATVVRTRMAHLNHALAKFRLYELDEQQETLQGLDPLDAGNIRSRLVHFPDPDAAWGRLENSILKVKSFVPECEVVVETTTEVCFRLHGLEFARARLALTPGSFQRQQELSFGTGRFETPLVPETESRFAELVARLCESRRANAESRDSLWRMQPERWLESLVVRDVAALNPALEGCPVYSQVPAFTASDRAMIDVLTCTRSGRLAVLELKADEDIHLPLQGLDYWARVRWHHERGELQQFGYFNDRDLSAQTPLLLLVAPALRVHPATDALLRYLHPEIEWALIGIDEDWRNGVKVVFRKRNAQGLKPLDLLGSRTHG